MSQTTPASELNAALTLLDASLNRDAGSDPELRMVNQFAGSVMVLGKMNAHKEIAELLKFAAVESRPGSHLEQRLNIYREQEAAKAGLKQALPSRSNRQELTLR